MKRIRVQKGLPMTGKIGEVKKVDWYRLEHLPSDHLVSFHVAMLDSAWEDRYTFYSERRILPSLTLRRDHGITKYVFLRNATSEEVDAFLSDNDTIVVLDVKEV